MQNMAETKTLSFKVTKKEAQLIAPAEPTPYEFKYLSNIDQQQSLRFHVPVISFYRKNPFIKGKDPVNVIRHAIAKALIFYYPFAGRLREYTAGKLAVECTGDGVVFVEADADIMLQHFGDDDALYPPFPNLKDLVDIQGFDRVVDSPLLFFQVTRLKCGGFILAYIFNHTMCDAAGFFQFMYAVGELARGAAAPSIPPVWQRHLLTARHPPHVLFAHREYDVVESASDPSTDHTKDELEERSFFFSAADVSALRRTLPQHLQGCSKFEVVAGCAWRCRTIALSRKPDDQIRFICTVDMRKRMNPPLPVGYYGNVLAFPAAVTSAEELWKNPLGYAVGLVRKVKYEATDEYMKSVVDLMVTRDLAPSWTRTGSYLVTDLTRAGFDKVDVGWGTAAYGGAAYGIRWFPNMQVTGYLSYKDKMGEVGIIVPICVPRTAMEVFVKQLHLMMTAASTTSAL